MQGIIGYLGILALAWGLSENRRAVGWRTVGAGLALHVGLALLLLALPAVHQGILALNSVVEALMRATNTGTQFLFGYLGGGALPFEVKPGTSSFVLAFQALPLVLVISALSALLYHWRVLPATVGAFAWALRHTLRLGGTAGTATAANVFVGMVEAPLLVKPYLARASRADLMVIMTAGLATIAGTVMVLYAQFLKDAVPGALGHLLTASVMNAPAAIVVARLMVPEAHGAVAAEARLDRLYDSSMDALTQGTADGLRLLLNVAAMLLVLVALVALVNMALGALPGLAGAPLSLERMLGWIMAPLAWAIGIPWAEAATAGQLLGTKVVLNELIAYLQMGGMSTAELSPASKLILTYALCGFANIGSLGIMLGGLTAMAPERRADILALGPKALLAGLFATLATGALAGMVFHIL